VEHAIFSLIRLLAKIQQTGEVVGYFISDAV
jgi:hypothetical protein